MDQKTYLKELAKHAQSNTTNPKEDQVSNQKQVQVSMHKETKMEEIDPASLELFRQMMADRYHKLNIKE